MSTPITRLEAYVDNKGRGEYPSLVTDIAAVIAQCRILQEQVKAARLEGAREAWRIIDAHMDLNSDELKEATEWARATFRAKFYGEEAP